MKLKLIQKKVNYLSFLILLVGIIFISGCVSRNAGESVTSQSGPETAVQPTQGLQIVLKDSGMPEVKYLQPTIKEVQLQNEGGKWITIWSDPEGKALKLTPDGAENVLDTVSVPAGTYIGTRLKVSTIDVEVDVNRDGDTLDKNVEIILTEEEFNNLPPKLKPSAPNKPSEPSEPTAPSKPTKPVEDKPQGEAPGEESPEPSEPTAPSMPSAPSEPEAPSQPSEPTAPSMPSAPSEPEAPLESCEINGLVYICTGEYLDEKHTATPPFWDGIAEHYGEYLYPVWKSDFLYNGISGKIIYDFTLHPLKPKHEQMSVEVSVTNASIIVDPAKNTTATVLLDNFDGATKGKGFGALTYEDSVPNLSKAVNLAKGTYIKYSFSPWYKWDGVHSWNRNEAAAGVLTEGRVEMWIKPRQYSGILTFNWGDVASSPQAGYIMHFGFNADGKLTYGVWGGNLDKVLVGKTTILMNKWTHVAVSWSPNGTKLYINGKVDASTSANVWPAFSGTVFAYLNYWGGNDLGLVDDLHISNVAEPPTISPPSLW